MTSKGIHVRSARLRRTAVVAAAVVATFALGACGADAPGAAAVVGGQEVKLAQVADSVAEVRAQLLADPQATFSEAKVTATNVNRLTRHLVVQEAVRRLGVTVTQAAIDDIISSSVDGQFGGNRARFELVLAIQQSVPASAIEAFAGDVVAQNLLAAKLLPDGTQEAQGNGLRDYFVKLSGSLEVRVAARFGVWDPAKDSLGPVSNELSAPGVVPSSAPSN